jgi:hypothetical protein
MISFAISSRDICKFLVSGAVGIGASKIVKEAIKSFAPEPKNLFDKVTIAAGAWILGGIVATAVRKNSNETIDSVLDAGDFLVETVQKSVALAKIDRQQSTFEDEPVLNKADYEKGENGKWRRREKKPAEIQREKLEKINRGKSTFEKEGLPQSAFYQDPERGYWKPIRPETVKAEATVG